ncbi:MAG: hypothetical protein JKY54_16345, partial [Flavobacteriales bacterium]|nr:hypothetical protein [Flavobacteriales bacterium]
VWMYQSSRPFTDADQKVIFELAEVFLGQWESHNIPVQGSFDILQNHFIRICAFTDEPAMCGKAQDAQVRLAKEIEEELNLELTNRMLLAFNVDGKPKVIHLNELELAITNNEINSESEFYNNLIQSKSDFKTDWKVSAGNTWLSRYF